MKMLIYFLAVMLLLASFNLWSYTYFSRNVDQEIITYNRTITQKYVDSFESQYNIWRGLLLSQQFDERVQAIARQGAKACKASLDYTMVASVIQQLSSMTSHPSYYFDNVMIHYKAYGFLLEKEALIDADRMFTQYYENKNYPLSYWLRSDGLSSDLTASPSRVFSLRAGAATKLLMPIELNLPNEPFSLIAFVDMEKWNKANLTLPGSQQLILDAKENTIFESAKPMDPDKVPAWDGHSPWVMKQGTYYFFEKGRESGFTYITAIPFSLMKAKLLKLNWIILILFASTLILALLASWRFSRNIHQPLKMIMKGMQHTEPATFHSPIKEFNAIQNHMKDLLQERNRILLKLQNSASLLTNYSYMVRLKNLALDSHEVQELPIGEGSFTIIVYQLRFRRGMEHAPAAYRNPTKRIREVIDLTIRQPFPDSHTFQMEPDQLLSVIYKTSDQAEALEDGMRQLKLIFDQDVAYYLITVAVSSLIASSEQFDQAYMEALRLVYQSRPVEETQILWDLAPTEEFVGFSTDQDQEFYVHLQAGNEVACHLLIDRVLDDRLQHSATASQLLSFSESVLVRTKRTMGLLKIALPPALLNYPELLRECVTPGHYNRLLKEALTEATRAVILKREESYDLIQYVMGLLESHYQEDISLDMLAHKLNMSASYLSVYIKENTGKNFIDHLNGIRLNKAKELLEGSSLSIQDVGMSIGYRNVTSFIRMFKKETGMPPGDYRKTVFRRLEHP
ncbi:helix-turn-helix domain-containing protein [Paenibacillus sp. HJGM_3]